MSDRANCRVLCMKSVAVVSAKSRRSLLVFDPPRQAAGLFVRAVRHPERYKVFRNPGSSVSREFGSDLMKNFMNGIARPGRESAAN